MAACPACDIEIDVDEFDVEEGDELSCAECGSNLTVATVLPVDLRLAGDDDEDEEDYGDRDPDEAEGDQEDDDRDA